MIQPMDIKTQTFKKGLFGYKAVDVNSFVDTVYRAYDELFKENAELSENLEKINASLQESRLKIFELENQLKNAETVSVGSDDTDAAKAKADAIIKNAEKAAAEIISKAKTESAKIESDAKAAAEKAASEPKKASTGSSFSFAEEPEKEEPAKEEPVKESASSKFFSSIEDAPTADGDDDEVFVGEIEEARKPDRMMIGDGEEEESMDFEFL